MNTRIAILGLALISTLVLGLFVIPTIMSSTGIVVPSGTSFSFDPWIESVNIPISVHHSPSELTGSFMATFPVLLYALNSNQFNSIGGECFDSGQVYANLIANSSSTSFQIVLTNTGDYHIVFCAEKNPPMTIQLWLTGPMVLR